MYMTMVQDEVPLTSGYRERMLVPSPDQASSMWRYDPSIGRFIKQIRLCPNRGIHRALIDIVMRLIIRCDIRTRWETYGD
jgi:hypothetical protein